MDSKGIAQVNRPRNLIQPNFNLRGGQSMRPASPTIVICDDLLILFLSLPISSYLFLSLSIIYLSLSIYIYLFYLIFQIVVKFH